MKRTNTYANAYEIKEVWYAEYQAEASNYAESSGNWLDTVDVYMGDVYYPWELGV